MATQDEKTKKLRKKFTGQEPDKEDGFDKKSFLETMRKRHDRLVKEDRENRDAAVEDQKFRRAGVKDQWDSQELTRRKKMLRPAIVLDELSRPINQVTGEMRLNKAHIQVVPADDDASLQVAKAYKDLIHEIEYDSKADRIYQYAGDMLCGCAYGAARVLTRYCDDDPFSQKIYLQRIKNPLLVYMDSSAMDEFYADAKYGFVMERIEKEEWEERYPKKSFPSMKNFKAMTGTSMELWFEKDAVWIGDYYVIEPKKTTFIMTESDDVMTEEEFKTAKKEWQDTQEEILEEKMKLYNLLPEIIAMQAIQKAQNPMPPAIASQAGPSQGAIPPVTGSLPNPPQPGPVQGAGPIGPSATPQPTPQLPPPPQMPSLPDNLMIAKDKSGKEKRREIEIPKVKHYIVSCDDILEGPHDIPGCYIPVGLAHGIDTNVDGKQEYYSLIRKAKGPQTYLNQVETAKMEFIGMTPHAPWIMTFKQYGPGGELFDASNVENRGALLYEPEVVVAEDGSIAGLAPPPSRVNVGQAPAALFQAAENIKNYIEDAVGVAGADTMNVPSPERTGAANRGKRKASDIGTFHFIDNVNGLIEHLARIIVSMIPEVYDTDRDVRMMSDDEVQSFIPINTTNADALKRVNGNQGRYPGLNVKDLEKKAKKDPKGDFNKLSKGRYDVFTKVGPPFSTAREEASEHFMMLAVQGQKMNPLDKYFAIKHLDLADGGEYAEAVKATIPEWLLPPKEGENRVKPPENPQQALIKMKTQVEQAKLQQQGLHMKLRMIEIAKELQDKGEKANEDEKKLRLIVIDELQKAFGPSGGGQG